MAEATGSTTSSPDHGEYQVLGEDPENVYEYRPARLTDALAQLSRERLGGVLPEGFTITEFKNGNFLGRWWGGDIRGPSRDVVENWLFLCATNGAVNPRAE